MKRILSIGLIGGILLILWGVMKYIEKLYNLPDMATPLILLLIIVISPSIYKILFQLDGEYKKSSRYGSHGTSDWLTPKEIRVEYQMQSFGFLFGSTKKDDHDVKQGMYTKFLNEGGNGQVLVFGPPGSYKTTAFVLPNTSHITSQDEKPDFIITDTKGEVKRLKEKELINKGYDVYTLDFVNFEEYDGINIFDFITEEQDVLEIASSLKQLFFKSDQSKNSQFWQDSFFNTIIAMISIFQNQKEKGLIERFSFDDIISNLSIEYIKKHRKELVDLGGIAFNAYQFIDDLSASKETMANVLVTIRSNMATLSLKKLKNTIGRTTCDIRKLGRKVCELQNKELLVNEFQQIEREIKILVQKMELKKEELRGLYYTKLKEILMDDDDEDIPDERAMKSVEDIHQFIREQTFYSSTQKSLDKVSEKIKEQEIKIQDFYQDKIEKRVIKKRKIEEVLNTEKKKPMAIFILLKDNDDTYSVPINLILTTMMTTMYKTARKSSDGVALDKPVVGILEEFCNIGRLDVIIKSLATMRGRRIFLSMIVQSVPQLKKLYPNDYEEIFSMCDYKVVLGCADSTTAKLITDSIGSTTIRVQNTSSKERYAPLLLDNGSVSNNYTGRKLIFESELQGFDKKMGIVLKKGSNHPAKFHKVIEEYWKKR